MDKHVRENLAATVMPNDAPKGTGSPPDIHGKQALLVVVSELCFIALPFIVYVLVLNYTGKARIIFTLSEWAFASVLLLGQSLARFFTLLMSGRKPKITGKPLIVFVVTLVFGLVPSVIVLVIILLGVDHRSGPENQVTPWFPNGWVLMQVVLFGAALVVYFILVGAYEYSNSQEREIPDQAVHKP